LRWDAEKAANANACANTLSELSRDIHPATYA